MIFYCNGGYGHRAASEAIKPLLENDYELLFVNPFTEILESLDFAKKITGHDCDQVYNYLLRNGWVRFMNFYCKNFVTSNIRLLQKKMQRKFLAFFKRHNPDSVISLIPVINLPASNAAYELAIPYTMVTLDHDTMMWQIGLNKINHDNITVFVHNQECADRFYKKVKRISRDRIIPASFPVRQNFLALKDCSHEQKKLLKKEWDFPLDKPIVLIMMGGVGARQTSDYVRQLSRYTEPLHLVVCTGSNEQLNKKITPLIKKANPQVSFSLVPFTQKIPELLAVADLLITKPGPGTVEEALVMGVPLLLDKTVPLLFWERENVRFATKNSFAQVIRRRSQIKKLVHNLLRPAQHEKAKSQLRAYHSSFNELFVTHVKKQLNESLLAYN